MCPLQVDLFSVTFDSETVEIRLLIVTHRIKIQHFPSLPGFPHIGHWTQLVNVPFQHKYGYIRDKRSGVDMDSYPHPLNPGQPNFARC